MKGEIPELWEEISEIKYIGEYLKRGLNEEGIYLCQDLVKILEEFGEEWEDEIAVRRRVREWLREVLINARANKCCYPASKIIEGEECTYKARKTNEKGYNAIIGIWNYYAINPYRKWIPRKFRGLTFRNKYPKRCEIHVLD